MDFAGILHTDLSVHHHENVELIVCSNLERPASNVTMNDKVFVSHQFFMYVLAARENCRSYGYHRAAVKVDAGK